MAEALVKNAAAGLVGDLLSGLFSTIRAWIARDSPPRAGNGGLLIDKRSPGGCARMRNKDVCGFRPASIHVIEVVPRNGFDALRINTGFFGNQLNELLELIAHDIAAVPMGDVEAALIAIKVEGGIS